MRTIKRMRTTPMPTNIFRVFQKKTPIRRFTRVESWLARGGQPDADGFKMLALYGFKTIVTLRRKADRLPKDLEGVLTLVQIPVKNHKPPAVEQAMQWLELCADPANHPIFEHCEKGEGRTSTFLGLVRIAQGWEIDRIINEGIHIFDFPETERSQIAFLRDFSARVTRGEVLIPRLPDSENSEEILTAREVASGG